MDHPLMIQIAPDGTTTLVFHPDKQAAEARAFDALGTVSAEQRGGHVYPKSAVKRAAFKALRRVFGGKGAVADWTRRWSGPWIVRIVATGDVLPGTFRTHADAVDAEVRWILNHTRRN